MTTEIQKLAIAMEYLDTAAILWLHEINYFSSAHLAGAAEELAGKACRIEGMKGHFDELRMKVKKTLSTLNIPHTEKEITEAVYGAKNAIKHMDSRNDASVNIDARKEATDYIIAAYRNFEKLGLEGELSSAVKEVVEANAIHVEIGP